MYRLLLVLLLSSCAIAAPKAPDGSAIYARACSACHYPKIAHYIKAPAFGDQHTMAMLLAKAKEQVAKYPELYSSIDEYWVAILEDGVGQMPPGANCFKGKSRKKFCSKAEYLAAINYMISEGQDKDAP